MSDRIESDDIRIEFDGQGRPIRKLHKTKATLRDGLGFVRISGKPVAVEGTSGRNESRDHLAPKEGQVLAPLPDRVRIVRGVPWVRIGGRPVATRRSRVQVPDAERPFKEGVIVCEQELARVDGAPIVRGEESSRGRGKKR